MKPIWETVLPRVRKNIAEKKATIQPTAQSTNMVHEKSQNPHKRKHGRRI